MSNLRRTEESRTKILLEEIMPPKSPSLAKNINLHLRRSVENIQPTVPRNVIVKLLKNKENEKIVKAAR